MVNPSLAHLIATPLCAVCGSQTSYVELVPPGDYPASWETWGDQLQGSYTNYHRPDRWRFLFRGIEAGNGIGDDISAHEAARLSLAFEQPLEFDRVHAAGLYDDAGFCASCRVAFCRRHWSVGDGAGQCPQGHFRSLDPHWYPDES